MDNELKNNELIYDEQIAPLMNQILSICKENKMPMFATFSYAEGQQCTSSLPIGPDECEANELIDELWRISCNIKNNSLDIKTYDKDNKITNWTRAI